MWLIIYLSLYYCSDFPSALPGVYEQTVRETEKLLQERGLNKLTSQQKDLLKGQTEGITSSDHTVFNLISKYAKLVSICHLIISTYHGFILGVFGPNKALLTGCGLRGPTVSDYPILD